MLNGELNQTANSSSSLTDKIAEYSQWRESLIAAIDAYIDWPGHVKEMNAIQELRLYDIKELLKKDQLILAFLAEFSRGKTETINALFFSDFNQRLLPSEAGRTTMCPTEIYFNENEAPCIKLLPIETRQTDDTLNYLKTNPEAWHKVLLDTSSADSMKQALRALVQTRKVDLATAKKLGFSTENDPSLQQSLAETGVIEIPAWRHALINYPHPLLKNGLVVLDTPGLNAIGTEPELTLSIIPSAQAIIFLTAIDTGITKSDMQVWTEYVQKRAAHKLVLLNKIDNLWDGLESEAEVDAVIKRQIQNTAQELALNEKNIFAISAQKALLAKIKKNNALLQRSGINAVENALAEQIVRSKHEVLGKAIITECSNMIRTSRKLAQIRVSNIKNQLDELYDLQLQHQGTSKEILAKVIAERKRYETSILTFNQGTDKITKLSNRLLRHLSSDYLDPALKMAKQDMGDNWTTVGLNKSIRSIARQTAKLAENIMAESKVIKQHADELYQLFHKKHGLEKNQAANLDLSKFTQRMQALEKITDDFCASPVNIMTEKHFLIRKFFLSLGSQIEANFEETHTDCNHWVNSMISELKNAVDTYKSALDKRAASLMESHDNTDKLIKNIKLAEKEYAAYQEQAAQLDMILLRLMRCVKLNFEQSNTTA
jgi:hypothetical protein